METMSAYVPPHRKRDTNEQEWDCSKCVVRGPARNCPDRMRCFNCGTRKPGYSVLGFGLQKKRDLDEPIKNYRTHTSKHCIPDGYASLNDWINHLKKNVVSMMKQKYNFWEVFTYIPIEVFEDNIFPLVQMLKEYPTAPHPREISKGVWQVLPSQRSMIRQEIIQLARCAQVCRSWNACFKRNEFWKKLYLCRKVLDFYDNRLQTLASTKLRRQLTVADDDIYSNRCPLKVINLSKIPFDIYWISQNDAGAKSNYKGSVSPSKVMEGTKHYYNGFHIQTYPGHNWFCIPKLSWLLDNHVSSIGFAWTIDILLLENMNTFDTDGNDLGTKPYCVIRITEKNPDDYMYIAGTQKKYKNYRHAVMKQVINRDTLKRQKKDNEQMKDLNLKDRRALKRRLNSNNEAIHHYECKNRDLDYVLKIVK